MLQILLRRIKKNWAIFQSFWIIVIVTLKPKFMCWWLKPSTERLEKRASLEKVPINMKKIMIVEYPPSVPSLIPSSTMSTCQKNIDYWILRWLKRHSLFSQVKMFPRLRLLVVEILPFRSCSIGNIFWPF